MFVFLPCRCSPSGIPFLVGMVAPLVVFSILAMIVFAVVGVLIVSDKLPRKETRSKALRDLLIAVFFVTGWGVTLGKAYTSGTITVVLAAAFVAFGAPLGLYMFVMSIFASRTTRNVWKRWLCRLICRKYHEEDLEEEITTNMSKLSKTPSMRYKTQKPPLGLQPLQYKLPDLKSPSPTSPTNISDNLNTSTSSVAEPGVTHSRESSASKSVEGSVDMPVADTSRSEAPSVPYKHPSLASNDIDPPDPNEETAL